MGIMWISARYCEWKAFGNDINYIQRRASEAGKGWDGAISLRYANEMLIRRFRSIIASRLSAARY